MEYELFISIGSHHLYSRNKIPVIDRLGEEQRVFVEGQSPTNDVYLVRTILESSLEVNKDLPL